LVDRKLPYFRPHKLTQASEEVVPKPALLQTTLEELRALREKRRNDRVRDRIHSKSVSESEPVSIAVPRESPMKSTATIKPRLISPIVKKFPVKERTENFRENFSPFAELQVLDEWEKKVREDLAELD
jgi:hypothetical protein